MDAFQQHIVQFRGPIESRDKPHFSRLQDNKRQFAAGPFDDFSGVADPGLYVFGQVFNCFLCQFNHLEQIVKEPFVGLLQEVRFEGLRQFPQQLFFITVI